MSRLALTVGIAAMETCWLAAWAVLIGWWTDLAHPRALLSVASIFGLVVIGALSTHLAGRRAVHGRALRTALVGLGVILVLLVVRQDQYPASGGLEWLGLVASALAVALGQANAPALAFGLGLVAWWRGVGLGSQPVTFPDVESAFRRGIGVLVAFAIVVGVTTRPSQLVALEGETTDLLVAFFFFSLLSLALGRLESLRTRTRALAFNSQWVGVLVGASGAVVLLALVLAQALSFDALFLASRPLFDLLGRVLLLVIYVLVIPLAYLVELLIYAVLSLLQPGANRPPPDPLQPADIDNLLSRLLSDAISPDLAVVLKAAGAGLLVIVALLIIARAIARWRPGSAEADATAEERDSLWRTATLRQALLAWLRRLLRRGRPVVAVGPQSATVGAAPDAAADQGIRAIYRALLARGAGAGAPRPAERTALEHQPVLERALPPEVPVAAVTAAYQEARYADTEPTATRVARLRTDVDAAFDAPAPRRPAY